MSTDTEQPAPLPGLVEPMFVLRGSDPSAYLIMLVWAAVSERLGTISRDQFSLAAFTASAMEDWARAHGQDVQGAMQAWASILNDAATRLQYDAAMKLQSSVH